MSAAPRSVFTPRALCERCGNPIPVRRERTGYCSTRHSERQAFDDEQSAKMEQEYTASSEEAQP